MLGRIRTILTDRFVIFFVIGVCLFIADLGLRTDAYRIELGENDFTMIEGRWLAQSGEEASQDQLRSLAEFEVREEILVREALRRGLDQDDIILRRRLAQKMEMLIRDQLAEPEISDEALATYYAQASNIYTQPKRVGFRHIFLGTGDRPSGGQVSAILSQLDGLLDADGWRSVGEPFMLARQYGPKSDKQVAELFGDEFAETLMQADERGSWQGPVRSSYGWHLVQVLAVQPASTPKLEEVRATVYADLREKKLAQQEDEAWQSIRSQYSVNFNGLTQ